MNIIQVVCYAPVLVFPVSGVNVPREINARECNSEENEHTRTGRTSTFMMYPLAPYTFVSVVSILRYVVRVYCVPFHSNFHPVF
jgi:hypothetical protein